MSDGSGLFGDWDKAIKLFGKGTVQKAIDLARNQIGVNGVSMVKKGIVGGAPGGKEFAPLSDWTKERKGSSKPLIDTGDLLGSITHELSGNSEVWIGVRRGARAKNGKDIVDIAAVHEFGCTIAVTAKMRAYLHYQGIHLEPDTTHIVIPERSFLRATLESDEFQKDAVEKTKDELKKALRIA
jgi:phage gpG-like protein